MLSPGRVRLSNISSNTSLAERLAVAGCAVLALVLVSAAASAGFQPSTRPVSSQVPDSASALQIAQYAVPDQAYDNGQNANPGQDAASGQTNVSGQTEIPYQNALSGPNGMSGMTQPMRAGGSQWICKGEPPPPGKVITGTGESPDCAGLCNGALVEPLRGQMVICGGQPVPDGFEVVENTTSPRCGCIASSENALVIRLLPGAAIPGSAP